MDEHLIKQLVATISCTSCGQRFEPGNIEVIERKEELWFIKVICSSCHISCFVAAIIREERPPALITDLDERELERFRDLEAISEDDLLEMHRFLKGFSGEIPDLFRKEDR